MQTFQSTFLRDQYIEQDIARRGGGTVEDAAKRLAMSPEKIRHLIDSGELDALVVPLRDGSLDIIIPEAEIQRYGVERKASGSP
jgi:hypothetical protein